MARPRISLADQPFGKLTAIEPTHLANGRSAWRCRCECGNETIVTTGNLRNGSTISCGCHLEAIRGVRHGGHGTPEYRSWKAMKTRCTNPKAPQYKRHGGRGIKVCQRWLDSFAAFLEDMGPRPSEKHSIDRINNEGDYTPDNCRWATQKQQQRNRRNNRRFTIRGITLTLPEWAEQYGLKYSLVAGRLQCGWSIENALTTPKGERPI